MDSYTERYVNLKPKKGEEAYAEWDEEFEWYGVFGVDSGFCYASFGSKEEAEKYAENMGVK